MRINKYQRVDSSYAVKVFKLSEGDYTCNQLLINRFYTIINSVTTVILDFFKFLFLQPLNTHTGSIELRQVICITSIKEDPERTIVPLGMGVESRRKPRG